MMIFFMSQAPFLVVFIPILILVGLVEMIGLKIRRNILVLSATGLVCLGLAAPVSVSTPNVAGLLYATGVTLSVMLALYALATARRGKQRRWFAGVLLVGVATLAGAITARAMLAQQNPQLTGAAIFALSFVPGMSALLYGLFAPDIPKLRGSA